MTALLKNKQIVLLFAASFATLFTGMGLLPILPLYAARFEATNSLTGFYFAAMYAANALGPVAAGWLTVRFSKKVVFLSGALLGLPALLGLAAARTFIQVVVFTSLLWFAGGVVLSLVSIFTGLHTNAGSRGKAFSLMAMVAPLGTLVGGAAVGQLVSRFGYSTMFLVLAASWIFVPLIGWFLKEGPQANAEAVTGRPAPEARVSLGTGFARLLVITFLGSMAVNVSRLGSGLSMNALQFSPEAVSQVAMISGLVAIPATLAIGTLSDRLGRRHFLFASFIFAMSGSFILVGASTLWQFGLAAILHLLAFSISGAMAQALVTEVVPAQAVSKSLSYLNMLSAAANIVCFAIGGVLYDLLGLPVVFASAAALALLVGTGVETLVHSGSPDPVMGVRLKWWKLLITR